jgi:HSP20 family molecular chaperone IbpA
MKYELSRRRGPFGFITPFLDDFFGGELNTGKQLMKTDIQENETSYLLSVELPAVKKEDIKISLEDGYLNIKAEYQHEEQDEKSSYLRRERHYGSASRSFYVGDAVKDKDISAKLENGVLNLEIKKVVETKSDKQFIE